MQAWVAWEERLPPAFKAPPGTPFHRLFVPTVDTVRYQFLVSSLMQSAQHTLLLGATGTGKTAIAQNYIGLAGARGE